MQIIEFFKKLLGINKSINEVKEVVVEKSSDIKETLNTFSEETKESLSKVKKSVKKDIKVVKEKVKKVASDETKKPVVRKPRTKKTDK